jgi:hypothetical protein
VHAIRHPRTHASGLSTALTTARINAIRSTINVRKKRMQSWRFDGAYFITVMQESTHPLFAETIISSGKRT